MKQFLSLQQERIHEILLWPSAGVAGVEMCGVILGGFLDTTAGRCFEATSMPQLENVATRPETSFLIAPDQLYALLLEHPGEELIGVWHTHLNFEPATPSPSDVLLASQGLFSQDLVVHVVIGWDSPQQGFSVRAWVWNHDGHFDEIDIRPC